MSIRFKLTIVILVFVDIVLKVLDYTFDTTFTLILRLVFFGSIVVLALVYYGNLKNTKK